MDNNDLGSIPKNIKFAGNLGSQSASDIYKKYSQQNSTIYIGYADWTSDLAKTMDSNTTIIIIINWLCIAITPCGYYFYHGSGTGFSASTKLAEAQTKITTIENTISKLPTYSLSGTTLTITKK